MEIRTGEGFKRIGKVVERLVSGSSKTGALLDDATFSIGLASDPKFGVPASAVRSPIFVGDKALVGDMKFTPELDRMYRRNHASVDIHPVYNGRTGKYDLQVQKARLVGDAAMTKDASFIDMQMISPWNASYFPELYKQPLLYSHARDLVSRKGATNPWGEVQNLQLAAYSGWAQLDPAGTVGANLKKNVNVQGGVMTNPIINVKVYFNFTTEEMQRAKGDNGSPFAGSLMAEKQKYAQYVLDMITDYLTYYGNDETGTPGLFGVNGITTWGSDPMATIAASTTNVTKGSTMYQALAKAVKDFMDASYNKFDVIRIAMAPAAYNILASTPYSDNYSPESALSVFTKNFAAGATKNGDIPDIEIYSDPLLAANNGFNTAGGDRLVITAPKVDTGTEESQQDILLLSVPLENFVYPVYPNAYDQEHCVLRRFGGVFAPVPQAVKVYSGFGIAG